ncbi:MAG: aminopeptidase P family protein, partial [Spirochaetales bacterium]
MHMIDRIAALQKRMETAGIDLALFGCGPSYQYLTGIDNGWRFRADMVSAPEILLVPAGSTGGEPVVLSRSDSVGDQLHITAGQINPGRIAVGDRPSPGVWEALIAAFPDATLVTGDALVEPIRLIKDADEIAALRKAARLTDEAVRATLPAIREGVTMRELQLEIEMYARRNGAVGTSFDIVAGFVQSGSEPTGSIFSYGADEG